MRSSRLIPVLSGAAVAALAACNPLMPAHACLADYRYGINVTIVDSITEAPPSSAVLIAQSGAYVDSVGPAAPQTPALLLLSTAGERAGTYHLTVRAPGYREWTRSSVKVTADDCHVHPVAITARLQP
ncbi:MAG TPA: carboxypeptidase-like regulatory domain-containing protein [Longimicrobiaceae bacterium]|nr:carboxypeptidase-like regulatory domain-containing protein [Longimicrobiaceae bacterium]